MIRSSQDQEPDDVNDVDENPWYVDDIKPRDLLAFGTYNGTLALSPLASHNQTKTTK